MTERSRSWRWKGLALGLGLSLVVVALAPGCGGGSEVGEGDYSQKFEPPSVAPTPPKAAPPTPYDDMSPREKKEAGKSG